MNAELSPVHAQWTIIGAGPAGIAVVGKLLDAGIQPTQIAWIDPAFKVGDFGTLWRPVSSNTTVRLFLAFLNAAESFGYKDCPIDFPINHLPPQQTCNLHAMVEPLQWISDHLKEKVIALDTIAKTIDSQSGKWIVTTPKGTILSDNVVLAIGAEALTTPLSHIPHISVEQAMNIEKLKDACSKDDVVAVFGSSHTAIIALYNLVDLGTQIINFYRSPLKYAVYYDDWILYDNTGLKGYSATWAKEHMEETPHPKIRRVNINDPAYEEALKECTKFISAIGFERRTSVKVLPCPDCTHDPATGIIAPGLFGFGIAFPQGKYDRQGNYELQIGLWKFMNYLTEVLPIWLKEAPKEAIRRNLS
jgi:hypothetical protein